ncbi:MAG: hypothetical protein HOV68_19360 [Streptomycetaceae bacterium]|nr:hypothetical protein [Streptomycetaceae bacterium]
MTAPASRTPRSESAARGFPAFPAGRRGGRGFARTWWGRAWIQAVEDSALDLTALKNGRKYAFTGRVGSITVSPGRLAAPVHGDEADAYATVLALQPLTPAQWDRFLDQVASRAGHIAALLDRDMPHDLVAAAADVGVPLLPDIGDLDPSCDCEDWGHPCRHAAALAYQAAWLVDEDPFLLLLLRGLGEQEFLAALQQRGAEAARSDAPRSRGRAAVSAEDAYAAVPGPLPETPELPDEPGDMAHIPAVPDTTPDLTADVLRLLAKDAAIRALELLRGEAVPVLDERADAVRLAAVHAASCDAFADTDVHARLRAAHDPPADFARAVAAWHFGGATGLDVLDRPWSPPRNELARAQVELAGLMEPEESVAAVDEPEALVHTEPGSTRRIWRNRWTHEEAGVQLRYGPDGRWYPYRSREGTWWPSAHSAPDAVTAFETV